MKKIKKGSQEYSGRWEEELRFQWSDSLPHLSYAFGRCLWILDVQTVQCWGGRMVLNSPRHMYSKQIGCVWERTSWTTLPLSSLSLTVKLVLRVDTGILKTGSNISISKGWSPNKRSSHCGTVVLAATSIALSIADAARRSLFHSFYWL